MIRREGENEKTILSAKDVRFLWSPFKGRKWRVGQEVPMKDANNKPTGQMGVVELRTYETSEGIKNHLTVVPLEKSKKTSQPKLPDIDYSGEDYWND
jgi:hypothetical protein